MTDQKKNDKPDVSLNDLEKDLEKANERVQDYLTAHAVKQGYHNPDDPFVKEDQAKQNDPENVEVKDHSAKLSALEVAEEATKDRAKQDKERAAQAKKAAESSK